MVWGMLSGSSPPGSPVLERPIPAVSVAILRAHLGRQLVERLGTERGVLYQVDRVDTVSRLRQCGDDAGGQGVGIATRRFIDRLRNYPIAGIWSPDMPFSSSRHDHTGVNAACIPPLRCAGLATIG